MAEELTQPAQSIGDGQSPKAGQPWGVITIFISMVYGFFVLGTVFAFFLTDINQGGPEGDKNEATFVSFFVLIGIGFFLPTLASFLKRKGNIEKLKILAANLTLGALVIPWPLVLYWALKNKNA